MSTMRSSLPTLGCCPDCGAEIVSYDGLKYETDEGDPAVWTDCPICGEIIHPE